MTKVYCIEMADLKGNTLDQMRLLARTNCSRSAFFMDNERIPRIRFPPPISPIRQNISEFWKFTFMYKISKDGNASMWACRRIANVQQLLQKKLGALMLTLSAKINIIEQTKMPEEI